MSEHVTTEGSPLQYPVSEQPSSVLATLRVDQTALKVNQAMIIGLLGLAFLIDSVWLVGFVAVVMALGTLWPAASLFKSIYHRVLRPLGLLQPMVIADDPQPHLFAQGVGALVLMVAIGLFAAALSVAAWVVVGIVVLLAAVNLVFAFCVGCFLYFQLAKVGMRPTMAQWKRT